jgi:AcrR family transcriptional regulator
MAEGKATKEAFVQALVTACQEKNYDKITVQDISQKANLNRQTFYYHLKTRTICSITRIINEDCNI